MKRFLTSALALTAVLTIGAPGRAQIQRLDLAQMAALADGAVHGTIVDVETIRIDHPIDGPELYYTTVFVQGRSLFTGKSTTVGVSFPGGFVDADNGVYNSEAPAQDEYRLGREVVAFHAWSDNMGGDFASNALVASHGGLYTTFQTPLGGTVVQGRGDGYAVRSNLALDELEGQLRAFARAK